MLNIPTLHGLWRKSETARLSEHTARLAKLQERLTATQAISETAPPESWRGFTDMNGFILIERRCKKTDYYKLSLDYEAKYGEAIGNIVKLQIQRNRAMDEAARRGEEFSDVYTPLIVLEKQKKARFRELSDKAWAMYKKCQVPSIDKKDCDEIINAVIIRAALDYENALSKRDAKAIKELETFASDNAKVFAIFQKIKTAHLMFKRDAHKDIFDIIDITRKIRSKNRYADVNTKTNPHRCPLCGNGVYIKRRVGDSFIVGCGGCSLTEPVRLRQ